MRIKHFLLAAGVASVLTSNAWASSYHTDSDDPDECISDWQAWSSDIKDWYDILNDGWQNLDGSHEYALDQFSYAKSHSHTEIYWGQCMKVTTINEDMVDEMNEGVHRLQRSAECGIEMIQVMRQREDLAGLIDDYNAGQKVTTELKVALEYYIRQADKTSGTWACQPEGFWLNFLGDQKSWAHNILGQI
ncbi:hypothetical protein [Celeribacter sp. SCSIO 80788]|uniref:hypothetical protein n=1 Tax=Celeribacter sp. SCSIO 80788 TaxID=3117013 RepID=UPI003DA637DD